MAPPTAGLTAFAAGKAERQERRMRRAKGSKPEHPDPERIIGTEELLLHQGEWQVRAGGSLRALPLTSLLSF